MRSQNLAGWMVWDLALDDFSGYLCGKGKYPLLKALNNEKIER